MKNINFLLFSLLLMFVFSLDVYASSVSIKSSSSSVNRGDSVTVTATVNAGSGIYTVTGSVYCTGAGVNNGIDLSYDDLNTDKTSLSRSVKITPTSSGKITCKTQNVRLRELAKDGEYALGESSITINVTNNNSSGGSGTTREVKEEIKEKSGNNSLDSLSVEGYEIDPKFNKDTLEYKLTVDEKVLSIKVNAKASDSKAEVKGTGEIKLSSGTNTIEIKVSAENGNEKIYKLIVNVEDQHPIRVKVDNKEFTLVKKNNDLINKLDFYEEGSLKIDGQDVVCYKNSKTGVVLVILKDNDNRFWYYIYNERDKSYSLYKYITVGGLTLQVLDYKDSLENYKKWTIKLQNQDIDIFKIKESHKVGLIYGTNIKTANTGFYVYDENENTLSKYYDEEINMYRNKSLQMKNYLMIVMGVFAFLAIVFIVISLIHSNKRRKRGINY